MIRNCKFILSILICVILVSCGATQKIIVNGEPGTEIYSPGISYNDVARVGTIGADGSVEVVLDGDAYYAYLLSKNPASDEYIPFALDYKNVNRSGCQWAKNGGIMATIAGGLCTIVGLAVGDDVLGAIGIPCLLAGPYIWGSAASRENAIDHRYSFKYQKKQSTNQDIELTQSVIKSVDDVCESYEVVASEVEANELSRSTITFRDYSSKVEGVYVGSGEITFGGNVIESYSNISIILDKIDKETVAVVVTDASGSSFFSEENVYKIRKNEDGTYSLTHTEISEAVITIDKNKNLIYEHQRVSIDDDVYTLRITAKIQ